MKILLLLFTLFIIPFQLLAQSNEDNNQQMVYTYLYAKDYKKAKALLDSKFLTSTDLSKKVIGYVYLADYFASVQNETKKVEALENAKKIALKTQQPLDQAYVNFGYTRYYLGLNQEELFLKTLNQTIQQFEHFKKEDFILTQLYFLRFKHRAKNSMDQSTRADAVRANQHALRTKNALLINFTYSNLGLYYKQKYTETGQTPYIDSASNSYVKSYEYSSQIQDAKAKNRSLVVYYLNSSSFAESISTDESKYLSLLLQAAHVADYNEELNDLKAYVFNNIGSYYERLGQLDKAENYFLKALELIKADQNYNSLHITLLSNLSLIAEAKGELAAALNYERNAKKLILANDQHHFESSTKSLEIYYQTAQKNQLIQQLEETNKIYKRQSYLYICLSILGIGAIIYMFYNLQMKKRFRSQQALLKEARIQ